MRGLGCSLSALVCVLLCAVYPVTSWLDGRASTRSDGRFGEAQIPEAKAIRGARAQVAEMMGLTVEEADELERRAEKAATVNTVRHADPSWQHHDVAAANSEDAASRVNSDPGAEARTPRVFHPLADADSRVQFDLSTWPSDEKIQSASLYLPPWYVANLLAGNPLAHPVVRVSVASLDDTATERDKSELRESRLFFLHGKDQWHMNVSQFAAYWLAKPLEEHGMMITVTPGPKVVDEDNVLKDFKPDFTRPSGKDSIGPELVVTPFVQHKPVRSTPVVRVRRDADDNRDAIDEVVARECRPHGENLAGNYAGSCNSYCTRFNVDRMGWGQFIVAPIDFEIGYCAGSCPFPLPQTVAARHFLDRNGISTLKPHHKVNITRHAKVQSLIAHRMNGFPAPSCVPISYSLLTVIYQDYSGGIVVRLIRDAIVKQCGCA